MNQGASPQKLPLEGVRVLELSHIVAGPSGGLILGDLGADVIKIEHPVTGDTARSASGSGSTFYSFNRNKKYLALDLGKPEGKSVFERLVAKADVVLDNFAPGALRRLGTRLRVGKQGQQAHHLLLGEGLSARSVRGPAVPRRAGADGGRARLPHRLQGPADARGRIDHRHRGRDLRRSSGSSPRSIAGNRRASATKSRQVSTKPSCSG